MMAKHASPARAELAKLQAELATVTADIVKLTADDGAATDVVIAARAAVEATGEDVAAACPRPILRRRMSGLPPDLGEAPPPPPNLADRLFHDSGRLAAALAHRDGIRASLRAAETERDRLTAAIDSAALAVVRADPEVQAIVGRVDSLMRQLAHEGAILEWLLAQRVLPEDEQAKVVAARFNSASLSAYWAPLADRAGAAAWAEAVAKLKRSADHPLP